MKTISVGLVLPTLIVSLFSINASAATTVYDQTLDTTATTGVSSAIRYFWTDPGFVKALDSDTEAWTYFNLSSNASFNQITWYGMGLTGPSDFAVGLTPKAPSNSWVSGSGNFSGNLMPQSLFHWSQITTSLVAGTSNIYAYTVDLSSMVTLNASSTYTLSIVNNYGDIQPAGYTGGAFYWAPSTIGAGENQTGVGGFIPGTPNGLPGLAFTLTNTAAVASPVPEPSTYSMLLSGLGMIGFLAFRRKKQQFGPMAFA